MSDKFPLSKIVKEFEAIASRSYREIFSHLPKDSISIGYFCPYVPEELIHATGALPLRLMGAPIKMSHVQAHLPANCCYLVKSSLESLLQGELDFLKGIVFSHTCDVMQGLAEIWAFQKRIPLQFNLMTPSRLDSDLSRAFVKAELERFKDFLESRAGKIPLENLRASIRLFNRIREKIEEIYHHRRKCPNSLSGGELAHILRAGYLMDRQRYLELLSELVKELPQETGEGEKKVPIYLAGNMIHSAAFFSLIEESGAHVIRDDLCSGARFLRLMVPEEVDPVEGLANRYLASFLCPSKHRGIHAPIETLVKEAFESGVKGVIFLLYKYCETHFFDYPDLKQALESKGIATLLLEVEDPSSSVGQYKIRIQAFMEMLNPI